MNEDVDTLHEEPGNEEEENAGLEHELIKEEVDGDKNDVDQAGANIVEDEDGDDNNNHQSHGIMCLGGIVRMNNTQ